MMGANDKVEATFHSSNTYGDPGADPAEQWGKPTADELAAEAEAYETDARFNARNSLRSALAGGADPSRALGSILRPVEDTWKDALESLQEAIFQVQEDNGWHERHRDLPEIIALIQSEASEALEEYREGVPLDAIYYTKKVHAVTGCGQTVTTQVITDRFNDEGVPNKVEGIASELADIIIRVLDASRQKGIPTVEALFQKHEFNKTRGYRHGGKLV